MKKSYAKYGNYDRFPKTVIKGQENQAWEGWESILSEIVAKIKVRTVLVVDCYPGAEQQDFLPYLKGLKPSLIINACDCTIDKAAYQQMLKPFLTEDRVFGVMCHLNLSDCFDTKKLFAAQEKIRVGDGLILVYGVGASLISKGDITIYCDMARWEIQNRYKKGASNFNSENSKAPFLSKYKQGYFIEWRMADKHKVSLWKDMDYLLDTNDPKAPKLLTAKGFFAGLMQLTAQPFRLVPYFDPGVWGGQWMQQVCGLPPAENYAWCFDGVPEENSLLLQYGEVVVEVPAMDLTLYQPQRLLGERVHGRFGAEFPIRFDFLDTMGGQNLSLQVHPLTEYIQNTFGMHYTQDESYYILDADPEEETFVYLGVKTGTHPEEMLAELEAAQTGGGSFPADKYINKISVKKHDHILIPAGTIHCSGANTMVLEISATPYIFTFKLWDWDRLGLDGLPRPIHIEHGKEVIQWERNSEWVMEQLVNKFEVLEETETYTAVKTGLHCREFIDTVRHTSKESVLHHTNGSVNMLNLVEGGEAIVESPDNAFAPFVVHYGETFIVPEAVGSYTIRPHGIWEGKEIMTIKASCR